MDHQLIKELAKDHGLKVNDLLALARRNDPFYCGQESQKAWGKWFAELWEQFGYAKGVHLRRVHYRIVVNPEPILKPGDAVAYSNTEEDWKRLCYAGKWARYLGYVDIDAFVDRRNPEPVVLVHNSSEPELYVTSEDRVSIQLPEMPEFPGYELEDFVSDQKYHLELWCEKATVNDVLLPVCENYNLNLNTAKGEFSLTQVKNFLSRIQQTGRAARILYISDFDPAGQSMPVAVARKVEWILSRYELDIDVKLFPLVLTFDQCVKYRLPRAPMKETKSKNTGWDFRKEKFEERYGEGATELDALESSVPGELERIIVDAIQPYYDAGLDNRVSKVEEKLQQKLEGLQQDIYDRYAVRYQEADLLVSDIYDAAKDKAEKLTALVDNTWDEMEADLEAEMPDLDDYPLPEPEPAGDQMEPLFDSNRDYMEQLKHYKRFQGK